MLLTDVRISLQSRLTSLFRREPRSEAPVDANERLLSQTETAQMLQPYMGNRNARAWLELDRNVDPSLPFVQHQGEISYRLGDVRAFVRRMPKSLSDNGSAYSVVCSARDRRSERDRRNGEFWEVLRERRELIDRRDGFDRRSGFERRQTMDDFGYGRNGDRRKMGVGIGV